MFSAVRNIALAAVVASFGAAVANAFPITYDFTATGTTGPLAGTVAHGTFSYDSSIVTPGPNITPGLLTALRFSWNGVAYNQTTANTGFLAFDAGGNLVDAIFGTIANCGAGFCVVDPVGANEIAVEVRPGHFSTFDYTVPGDTTTVFFGTTTAALAIPAPEPTTIALLGLGCVLVGVARRGRGNSLA
jgi:hypothetical protein